MQIAHQSRPKAFSYLRFSTPEQMQGDSTRRQTKMAEEYAKTNGLDLDTRSYRDLGVSAYRGRNAETGQLGAFLEAVHSGDIPAGSYLLVESIDRLSRHKARKIIRLLEEICDADLIVVTLADGRSYDRQTLDDDPMALMYALVIAMRANEESAAKSRRLSAVWKHKREGAADRPLTARVPAWLVLSEDRQTFRVLEDRAEIVRRIYSMSLNGVGHHKIAEALNAEAVPTFGNGKRRAAHWHKSYVSKILSNSAVIGEFTPHETVEEENGRKSRKALNPVTGYFPAVVDEDVFRRVEAKRLSGRAAVARSGNGTVAHLLAGLAKCPVCEGTMTRVNKGTNGGRPYLVCVRAKTGAGCTYKAVPQVVVEKALIDDAPYLCGSLPVGDSGLDAKWDKVQTDLEVAREQARNLALEIASSPSPSLRSALGSVEAAIGQLEEDQRELASRIAAVSKPSVERRVVELEQALCQTPLDFSAANSLLQQVLTSVVVDWRSGHLRLQWSHGGQTETVYGWPQEDAA